MLKATRDGRDVEQRGPESFEIRFAYPLGLKVFYILRIKNLLHRGLRLFYIQD